MLKHIHVNECDSTQDLLKEQLSREDVTQQLVVSCDRQHQGRGRGNHQWEQMAGTLCFSMNIKPHPSISFTAIELGVLLARYFADQGIKLQLKWPNDLWNEAGAKCGGILVQNNQQQMLAGIGINLFSQDARYGGVYLNEVDVDRRLLIEQMARFIHLHRYQHTSQLIADWERACGHWRQMVQITEGEEIYQGLFLGLGVHGEALLEGKTGVSRFYNGSLRKI